jgi:hypothetical protein
MPEWADPHQDLLSHIPLASQITTPCYKIPDMGITSIAVTKIRRH